MVRSLRASSVFTVIMTESAVLLSLSISLRLRSICAMLMALRI